LRRETDPLIYALFYAGAQAINYLSPAKDKTDWVTAISPKSAYPDFPIAEIMPKSKKKTTVRVIPQPRKRTKVFPKSRAKPRARAPWAGLESMTSTKPDLKMATVQTAPFSTGRKFGPSVMPTLGGLPQKDTDMTSASSWSTQTGTRMFGSDICEFITLSGNSTMGTSYSIVYSGGAYQEWQGLTPGNVSSRLSLQESIYQYYAWRKLLIEFVPLIGPSVTTGSETVLLTAALVSDYDAAATLSDGSTLFTQVSQVVPSVAWTAWEGANLGYSFSGKKLWETDDSGPDPEVYTQITLAGASRTPFGAPVALAAIRVTYVIDFYCPSFVNNSPAMSLRTAYSMIRKLVHRYASEFKHTNPDCKTSDIKLGLIKHLTKAPPRHRRGYSPLELEALRVLPAILSIYFQEPDLDSPSEFDIGPGSASSASSASSSASSSSAISTSSLVSYFSGSSPATRKRN